MKIQTLALILPASALLLCAQAQTYSVDWYKVAGGGGTSTNATHAVSGTVGQADAGGAMTAGGYTVTGGFWSLISGVQTPGSPLLSITNAGTKIIVSWSPSATGFTLQTNSNPAISGNWSNYTGAVINNTVTNSPSAGKLFFRLKQ